MSDHRFVEDASRSIARGAPLSQEPGLGALTLPGFLREVTERFGTREALVQTHGDQPAQRWTYSELWDQAVQVARALVACGLGKGERVGVLMTNRAEFLSAVFGAALAGGVATPLSTFCTPSELEHLIASSACSVLLLERRVARKDFVQIAHALEPSIAAAEPGRLLSLNFPYLRHLAVVGDEASTGAIESWRHFLARGAAIPAEVIDRRAEAVMPSDPGALFFSSGSTSKPKGILSAQRGVAIQLWRMRRQQALSDAVRSWTANGFFWSGNFAMVLGATLAAGGSLLLQSTFQPEEALELMSAERASFLFAWPHQWAQLTAATNWASVDLSALRHVDCESPIARHPTIHTTWIEPRHCYGATETFTLSTGYPAGVSRQEAADSYGPPLPGNTLKIVDPLTGASVPIGERGAIATKGPTLMLGYLGTPLDETLDDAGFFVTGDGGYLDAEGRLFWEGRLNDIIKTGGANVSPLEIDETIAACPGVKMSQTIGVPHETLGELVVTCVVPQLGATLDEDAVRAFARGRLASFKTPRRVLILAEDDLHLTGSAKVKTGDLRKLVVQRLEAEVSGPGNSQDARRTP